MERGLASNRAPKQAPANMSLRLRLLSALSVLAAAATLVGSALAGSSNTAAAPSSSFTGSSSSGGSPSSSFSGSGTSGGSGDEGLGSDDSGSVGSQSGGTAGVAGFGPGGAAGMTVAAVQRLQAELARLGDFHHVVTGYYGLVTTAAVKQFQRSAGLKSDGIWGPRSETALKRRLSGK